MAVLVVVADGPPEVTRREDALGGSTMDWCAPGADLGERSWDLVLLSMAARTNEMVTWVEEQVGPRLRERGRYQWRDTKRGVR